MVEVAVSADQVRTEVREFLEASWRSDMDLLEWRYKLLETGWGMPMWPTECFGRSLDKELARVVAEEFERAQAPGLITGGIGPGMGAPTVMTHGTPEQRERWIPKILTGEEVWCQLFSEPGAGSDVASSQTRAERHGDEWIVNGQKVWTSGAQASKWGMLLCRTDWDRPKHEGLSYFIIDMTQPGVEVRPLRQMTGGASFNEVFFNDARVPHDHLIGELNGGWSVAVTTLMNERVSLGGGGVRVGVGGGFGGAGGGRRGGAGGGRRGGGGGQPTAEQLEAMRRMGRANAIELAKQAGRNTDPIVRQHLAKLHSLQRISQWNAQRSRAAQARGQRPGPEGSLGKLTSSRISRMSANLNALIVGANATLTGSDAPFNGSVAQQLLGYHSSSIAGGTDDIQRNIVGERVLGLPKDIQVDVAIPFKEVRVTQS